MSRLSDFFKWGPSELFARKAYDFIPMGVQGRPQRPSIDIDNLWSAYKRNEILFAAVSKKSEAAIGPRLMVQRKQRDGTWAEEPGHPFRRLMMRPNPDMDEAAFNKCAISTSDVTGWFYAEKVRGEGGLPVGLYPINPAKISPIPRSDGKTDYEFKDGTYTEIIKGENMLVKRIYDPESKYSALSPVGVCLASVDADSAQTDFVRAFFNNAGVPSGILKIKGRRINQDQADEIRARWNARLGRQWGRQHDISVLDEDAEYQKVGSGIGEIDSQSIRSFTESRISMTLGVPPLVIYAYVGLLRATYSNLKEAWEGFWDSTLMPWFRDWASFLTWALLVDFVGEDAIYGEVYRLAWDFSGVTWLQEDVDAAQARARENFKVGALTLNQFLSIIGQPADPAGDYYLRPFNVSAVPVGQAQDVLPAPAKLALPAPHIKLLQKAGRDTIQRRMEAEIADIVQRQYEAVEAA